MMFFIVSALAGSIEPCADPAAQAPWQPPMRLELGAATSYRWASYTLGSVGLGLDRPSSRRLSVHGGVQAYTAGTREIWLDDYESTRLLWQLQLGVRARLEDEGRRLNPVVGVAAYAIPRVEAGLAAELGAELWLDPAHQVGLRATGRGLWSYARPLAAEGGVSLVVRAERSR